MDREIKPTGTSKNRTYYWHDRLFKRGSDGAKIANNQPGDWWVQISVGGKQSRIPLKTPNKEAAAKLALAVYESLRANGWETTREKFPQIWPRKFERIESPTVGDYLSAVESFAGIKPTTFKSYARKFRRLVSGAMEIEGDMARYNHKAGAVDWRAGIDKTKFSELNAARITKWQLAYVAARRDNPLKAAQAITTTRSILRNTRSLFAADILKKLADAGVDIDLPNPLPFAGLDFGKEESHQYVSTIDAEQLARDASKELSRAEPEQFKIFLLAFGVGMRRGEIDRMIWPQFQWKEAQVNIIRTEYGDIKTAKSKAAVDVDPDIMKLFEKFKAKAKDQFVIESNIAPRPGANWHHYRCDCVFRRLLAWLRGKGVDTHNPIHTLRKEFGTRICKQFGIYAAREALRHSDIRLTVAHYVDKRGRIHLEVGKMLK
jgi:integrase